MVIYDEVGNVVPAVYSRLESPGGLTGRTKSASRGEYCGELGDQRSRRGVRLERCAAPGTWRLKRPRTPARPTRRSPLEFRSARGARRCATIVRIDGRIRQPQRARSATQGQERAVPVTGRQATRSF